MLQVRCIDTSDIRKGQPKHTASGWNWGTPGHLAENIPVAGATYEAVYDNGHNYWIRFPAGHVVSWRKERFEVVTP